MNFIEINKRQYLDSINLNLGTYNPVSKFMSEKEINAVAEKMVLPNGKIFPIPIFLDIKEKFISKLKKKEKTKVIYNNQLVGYFYPHDIFECKKKKVAKKVFGTIDIKHPGVKYFMKTSRYFVSGDVKIIKKNVEKFNKLNFTPKETKKIFKKKNWKTIVGFQTRNIPHLGHEFIQKKILKNYGPLFINPLVGEKKRGDFTNNSIIKSYKTLIKKFYPKNKVFFGLLTANMFYAGPREAILHAIIRKNYGCTHFVVGRDHAGVSNFYGEYEAHTLVKKFERRIGIKIIKFKGPFFCKKCKQVTNADNCKDYKNKKNIIEISGTSIRKQLKKKDFNKIVFVRKEILNSIKNTNLFL